MELDTLKTLINEKIKFKKVDKTFRTYQYYKQQLKELRKENIDKIEIEAFRKQIRESKYLELYKDILYDVDDTLFYQSEKHGIYHNLRVSMFIFSLANTLKLEEKDLILLLWAALYHDIGRINDVRDDDHGKRSGTLITKMKLGFSAEDKKIIKTIVTCHSLPDETLKEEANKNKVEDLERCERLFKILKDADGLDRVRLEYPYVKLDFLRTNAAKQLVPVAYELYYNYYLLTKKVELEDCLKYSHKRYRGKVRQIVDEQIKKYFEIENSDFKLKPHNYKIGDKVLLNKDKYLHGVSRSENAVDFVAKNGILSKEATGNLGNHAFKFVAGFWRVFEDITLEQYIKNYSGMDVRFEKTSFLVPYGELDKFVEDMKNVNHWLWESISSMEIRFMPSLAQDHNQYGFILNIESEQAKELIKNDINVPSFDRKISKHFGHLFSDKKKDREKMKTATFAKRASYVIFGMNRCFIEGVVVGRKVEKNPKKLEILKSKFPHCYICNLDGIVIM